MKTPQPRPQLHLEQARAILSAFGLPERQQNEMAAYVLLALSQVRAASTWKTADKPRLRVRDMIRFVSDTYGTPPFDREDVRRQVLHQFEQARSVDRNPDDPSRPTNSGKTCYTLTDEAVAVLRTFGTRKFDAAVAEFRRSHSTLTEKYRAERAKHAVEVELPDGVRIRLSAGRHNELQAAVVRQFWPRFIPDAKLLYLGTPRTRMPSRTRRG